MSQIKDLQIRKFNPGVFQSDEEVVAQFKVRHHELKTVLDILHDNIEAPSCQHTLILGPRGQGKTMLLARTAAELRSNEQFSEPLLPIRFMEESLEIFNMADFWLETLLHLARECQRFDPQLGQELHIRHSTLSEKWRSDSLEDLARNAVLNVADQLGRKLVLMIENLQALFEDVDEDFGWELRKTLQTEPQIILVGSATSRFEELNDANLPFFEFFWMIHLKPLNAIECQQLWTMINGQDISGRELRPLEILTGGSPRLLVIVASFARHKSKRRLMEELVLLIDEHTDYFRGNLEALPKTERRVFLAVIDLWQPSTPSEISIRARMDIRKVSTMLGRLVRRGAVIIEGSGRKRKYVVAERLYSIYYKLRRNCDEATVVQNLIRFMSVFYTEEEQIEAIYSLIEEMDASRIIRDALDTFMAENPEIAKKIVIMVGINHLHKIASRENQRFKDEVMTLFDKGDFAKVIQVVDQELSPLFSKAPQLPETIIAWGILMKATAYQKQGNLKTALLTVSGIIDRWSSAENPELQYLVAGALVTKIEILRDKGNAVLSLSTVKEIVKHFGAKEAPYLQECVACALVIKGEILQAQHKLTPALKAFEEAMRRLDAVESQEFRWCVAKALINKGKILRVQKQSKSAISTFEEVIKDFGVSEETELQHWVGQALIHKGEILRMQNHLDSSISVFNDIVNRFDATEAPTLVLQALVHKGEILQVQGHLDSSISVFNDIVNRFNGTEDPKLQNLVVRALIHKGEILRVQGQLEPALSTFELIIERFSIAETSDLQIMVSFAFLYKIMALCTSDEPTPDVILSAAEKAIEFITALEDAEFYTAMPIPMQKNLAIILMLKGTVFHAQNKIGPAKIVFEEVIERFGTTKNQELRILSIRALTNKLELQTSEGNIKDALYTYNEITIRLDEINGHPKNELTREALEAGTKAQLILGDLPAAVDSFRSLYAILEPDNEAMIRVISDLVINLIAAEVTPHTLLKIISSNEVRGKALQPVIVALKQEAGEPVRTVKEILEVAADIRKEIEQRRQSPSRSEENNPSTPSLQALGE